MAFLFKSKKHQSSAVPPQTKDSSSPPGPSGPTTPAPTSTASTSTPRDREKETGPNHTPTPSSSVNNSLNSLGGTSSPSPDQKGLREKPDPALPSLRNGVVPPAQAPTNPNASLYPWSKRHFNFTTPAPSPFPRYGAAVNAVASKEGDIYMMGGLINGATVKGDLWMVEGDSRNLSCYPIATTAEGPGPRVGHASLIVGNAFIVFGGDTKQDELDVLDDTLYLLNTATRQWSRANPPGTRPAGRYGHTLNIVGSKLYIFGGQVEGYFFNDLVAFDLNALQMPGNQWEILIQNSIEGGPPPGQIPPARTNHTMVNWGDKLFLFGGTDGVQWFNDVWTYDPRTNKWSQLDFIGHIPSPREGHAAALVGDVMYVFGGRTEEGSDLGDLAAFRISSKRWYTFHNMGPSPSPRSGHSMTAHDKQIIVVGGEPSSAPRDAAELSLVYVLDTGKIRYPNDPAASAPPGDRTLGNRRPSAADMNGLPPSRPPPSRDGSVGLTEGRDPRRMIGPSRESVVGSPGPYTRIADQNQINGPGTGPGAASRLPRASVSQTSPGPPSQQQAPPSRTNGVLPATPAPRNKTPTRPERGFSPAVDAPRSASADRENMLPIVRDSPMAMEPPTVNGSRTPTQQPPRLVTKPKEVEEPLPNEALSRSKSLQNRPQHPVDGVRDLTAIDSVPSTWAPPEEHPSSPKAMYRRRSSSESGTLPYLRQQNETLSKELQAAKNRNAWYASEMALARRAGYTPNPSSSPALDERAAETFGDDDRPLLEAFLGMRAELARMQGSIETQAALAASRVAEAENQRDVAVSEAVYAKTKLAAHGGSQASTPQPDVSSRDVGDREGDRAAEINRRLASSLALQAELQNKLYKFEADLQSERQARQVAENIGNAAEARISELDLYKQRNASEVESLRAELHQAQKLAREEAAQGAEAVAASKLLQVDKDDLSRRLEEALDISRAHSVTVGTMRDATAASTDKASLLEKKLEEERNHQENVERKLHQLRAEHEEMTAELENVSRRLRDAEDLVEVHAAEARTHREAVMSGLGKVSERDLGALGNTATEERVVILRNQVETSAALVRRSQAAADAASEKLRSAEERIAGLEAYQEQSSREGLTLRKQLQSTIKQHQTIQADNSDIRAQLAKKELEANAITVQHGALKDLLGERGINVSELRRSHSLSRPESGRGTPDQARLRELEQQLEASNKAQAALQSSLENRDQEAEQAYREKLEQLEHDYQSAVQYVKGTEKMLKRMKDELGKYQSHNAVLQTELEEAQKSRSAGGVAEREVAPASWEEERRALRDQIEGLQQGVNSSIGQLERQMAEMRGELASTQRERDGYKDSNQHVEQELAFLADQARRDLEQLKQENQVLEVRAQDAEKKVAVLLEHVVASVDNYRRQSRQLETPVNGIIGGGGQHHHRREGSALSTISHDSTESTMGPLPYMGGDPSSSSSNHGRGGGTTDNRNSVALDTFALELETLRSHWETTNKNYRLSSNTVDFEKTPTSVEGGELSNSLANWRKRLDLEEQEAAQLRLKHGGGGGGNIPPMFEGAGDDDRRDDGYNKGLRHVPGLPNVVGRMSESSGDSTPRRKESAPIISM